MVIQVDGKIVFATDDSVPVIDVVVVPGKIVNLITKPIDPETCIKMTEDEFGNKTYECGSKVPDEVKALFANG